MKNCEVILKKEVLIESNPICQPDIYVTLCELMLTELQAGLHQCWAALDFYVVPVPVLKK
jgi:hypothetical protein